MNHKLDIYCGLIWTRINFLLKSKRYHQNMFLNLKYQNLRLFLLQAFKKTPIKFL
jgi:hypothetical protein